MFIDLNTVPDQISGKPLPDLNEEPVAELEDEIHHLQGDHIHLHMLDEVHQLQYGQANYLQEEEHSGVHGIDLNVPACEEQQQRPHEVLAADESHQRYGDFYFDGPTKQDEYDHNLEAYDQQQEMQQMIDMDDYGVYNDVVDIAFHVEELEDSDVDQDEHANANNSHKCRNLTEAERKAIYEALLERSNHGKLRRNTTNIVAQKFHVSKYQVRSVWRRVKQCHAQGIPVDVSSRRKNCGRKKIQINLSDVLSVPLHRRRTIRSLAKAIGVKKSTLHRWFKSGLLRRHSSTLKPLLREDNKKESTDM